MNLLRMLAMVAGLGGVALGQAAQGGGRRPITFADLQAMKRVSDPQVSPSGKWVMFSVTEVSLEKNTKINNLWVVPIGGGEERQLTFGEVSQTGGRFSPDGRWVLLVSAGGGTSQIWTAKWNDADGTMAKPQPLTSLATEADGAVWSPDSKRILFTSSVYPECSEKDPSRHDTAAMNEKPLTSASQQEMEPVQASWAEEEACNRARMEAEVEGPGEGACCGTSLLYRHWNAFTGEKRSHVLAVSVGNGPGSWREGCAVPDAV